MSSHERDYGGNEQSERESTEQFPFSPLWPEALHQFDDGVHVPLSHILTDTLRPWYPPRSEDVLSVAVDIFGAFPEGRQVRLRGSTWPYQLLRGAGVERRGTLSMAISLGLSPDIQRQFHTQTARVLHQLAHFSDFDFMLPDVSASEFAAVNEQIWNNIDTNAGARIPTIRKRNRRGNLVSRYRVMVPSINGGRKERLHIEREDGAIEGKMPYSEATVRSERGKTVLIGFWTPAPTIVEGFYDTRLDHRYALSWDGASIGEVVRKPDTRTMIAALDAAYMADAKDPRYKRFIHRDGVYPPADFAKQSDLWFHLSKERIDVLTRPLEVGTEFSSLPVIEQVKLAIRACQKGALGEENLVLSIDGQQALYEHSSQAPALSRDAIAAFQEISLEGFRDAYRNLDDKEKQALQEEIMQYMLTGFFYPVKFIEYVEESGIARFFPQLADLPLDMLRQQMDRTVLTHEIYTRAQYTATHFAETGLRFKKPIYVSAEKLEDELRKKTNLRKLINPYEKFVQLLVRSEDIQDGNYMEVLDALLALEPTSMPQISYPDVHLPNPIEIGLEPADLVEKIRHYDEVATIFDKVTLSFLGGTAVSALIGISSGILLENSQGLTIMSFLVSTISVLLAARSHESAAGARAHRNIFRASYSEQTRDLNDNTSQYVTPKG